MRYVSIALILFAFNCQAIAQIDTLKFIDDTIMIVDGDKIISPSSDNGVFRIVERGAEFPGGNQALYKWIGDNVNADSTLEKDVVVNAAFTINSKGLPIAILAQGDTINGKGKEVISLIQRMPRWKPASQHGKVVKMRLAVPVKFSKVEKIKK